MANLEQIAQKLSGAVKPLDDIAGGFEAVLLAIVTRGASWAASIPNCLMVARSAMVMFDVNFGLGLTIAASLELIGHSLTSLWLDAKEHNSTKRAGDLAANDRLALGLVAAFFVIDLAMVAALCWHDYTHTGSGLIWLAMVYPVIGITTAIATNTRAHLWRAKQAAAQERQAAAQERQAKRQAAAQNGTMPAQNGTMPARQQAAAILAENPNITGGELGRLIGKSERLGRKIKAELAEGHGNNGHGGVQ